VRYQYSVTGDVAKSREACAAYRKKPCAPNQDRQFHFEPNKFGVSGLTPMPSELVQPERARECPVHLESRVIHLHTLSGERLHQLGGGVAVEVEVLRVHVAEKYVLADHHIDPEKWSPLIYNFRHYFRLADKELGKTFRAEK
jgi:flavin reductase (DIM6/NTAB) family NADH-FMN oxidoreductase RutF